MDANIWECLVVFTYGNFKLSYVQMIDKKHYKDFFESLSHVIPCEVFKNHYKKNIKKTIY